jgi:hypothetical protein
VNRNLKGFTSMVACAINAAILASVTGKSSAMTDGETTPIAEAPEHLPEPEAAGA